MLNTIIHPNRSSSSLLFSQKRDREITPLRHEIRTKRLYLRPVSEADQIEYINLFSDPAVMRFVGLEAGRVPGFEEIKMMHGNAVEVWSKRGYGRWSSFDAETGEFIGFCGFRREQGVPELVTALHQKFWNKNLAVEAADACLKYGFGSLGFTEVKAFTRPDNNRARKVLEKLNARFIGCKNFHGVQGATYLLLPELNPVFAKPTCLKRAVGLI